MAQQILIYWVIAQIFGLAGLPLARLVMRGLPHRGYPFAKALGLLVSGYMAWLLAMVGLAPFSAALVVACLLATMLLGILSHPDGSPRAIIAWLRASWRGVLVSEVFFTLALVYLATQRSYEWGFVGPHPWGTERPMDFAFFNAIQRSATFPPHDPWMSGFSINYYYLGYLLMACVSMLAGLPAGVSYNLSLALIYALTAQGVAGLIVALAWLARPHVARSGRSGWAAAALGVLLVLLAGNQAGALQVLTGTRMAHVLEAPDIARLVLNGIGPRATVQLSQPFNGDNYGGTTEITPVDAVKEFDWWVPSRALWDGFPDGDGKPPYKRENITEFPFFSFWLGDMHPHVMSLPFTLLALAMALAVVARDSGPQYAAGRRGWVELIVTGVVLGGLYVINSWDFPSYTLMFLLALLLRSGRTQGTGPLGVAWRPLGVQAALVVATSLLLYLPFHLTFRSLVGGRDPLIDLPILAGLSRSIGIVTWSRTPLHSFLIIFGLFLLPWLAWAAPIALRGRLFPAPWIVVLAALAIGALVGFPLLALAPLACYLALAALHRAQDGNTADAFVLAACALGCAICFGTDILFIRDGFGSRTNSIFKFYYQVWLIWGVSAAYAVWRMLPHPPSPSPTMGEEEAAGTGAEETPPPAPRRLTPGSVARAVVLLIFLMLLVGGLTYPALTISKLLSEGHQIGLDGTNPRARSPQGAAAIAWLRQNAPGDAVVLEAVDENPVYGYDTASLGISGVSSSTGLATVIGWTNQQGQWRAGDPEVAAQIEPRRADVQAIYTTTDLQLARDLLRRYRVRYVYVGATERASYPAEALAKFDQLGTPVFTQGEVTIYQIAS